jgi:ankyrin repeat protein
LNKAASLEQSIRTFRLFQILRSKDLEAISQELKESSKDSDHTSAQDKTQVSLFNGSTILHLAVQCAELSTVEYILAQPGVDINARNKDGNTALHLAADLGRPHVVRALLKHDGIKGFLPNYHGQHPIDLAQNADVYQQLQLAQSLFFDAKVDEVHRLVSVGDYDGLQSLLTDPQVQAVIDPNATELVTDSATLQSGGTLLHEAARKRDARLIKMLLLNGADPFRCDHRGKLPQDVTKDDKTRALLKRSPAAAAAHRGIQEKAILRGASPRNSIAQIPNSSSDVTVAGKEAREMKGYLKKWTNYTGGYKLRWFVLEDGVLSYYKHQGT